MRSRRRKVFINRHVQGGLICRILFHWLVFFAISFCTLPLWQLLLSGDPLSPFGKEMVDMCVHSAPVFIILLALLPVFVWDTVKLSHRLAGPMYRFHNTVKRLVAGEKVAPIKLRKGDAWTDFAADFNLMLERYKLLANQPLDGDVSCAEEGDEVGDEHVCSDDLPTADPTNELLTVE